MASLTGNYSNQAPLLGQIPKSHMCCSAATVQLRKFHASHTRSLASRMTSCFIGEHGAADNVAIGEVSHAGFHHTTWQVCKKPVLVAIADQGRTEKLRMRSILSLRPRCYEYYTRRSMCLFAQA